MKVVCICDIWMDKHYVIYKVGPKVGDECEVVRTYTVRNLEVYELKGYPDYLGYRTSYFAPVSNIDETTFERNYDKATV